MVNFRQPYLATSVQDFWRRWHISLSTWLRDYLYIPLGGNRYGERRTYGNLMLTMLLGGLWHGANWTFVVWGAIHGAGLSVERFGRRVLGFSEQGQPTNAERMTLSSASGWLSRIAVFHFVCFTWVFFRTPSIGDAFRFLEGAIHLRWIAEYGTAFVFLTLFTLPMFVLDLPCH
jgi:alginate O-acetyltransferase complex protein AlgI